MHRDFGSRCQRDSFEAVSEEEVPVKLRLGVRTVRAERMKIDLIDPRVEKLAEVGHTDPTYQLMVYHTEQQTDNKFLEEKSELKKAGVVRKELGLFQCQNGRKLVVRNSKEIVIPQQARKEMLMELHSTHMSSDGMKRLARGKFYWPQMSKDIEKVYKACEACKENAKSKNNVSGKRVEVIPSTMETGIPGELLCTDFGEYGRSNLLIIKDRFSGLLRVYITKDKTTEAATAGVERWSHTYGLPLEVRSDQGPCYGDQFTEWCKTMGIHHTVSAAYDPQSNGAAKRGVASIKSLLSKLGRTS